jgi:hypothetical protein
MCVQLHNLTFVTISAALSSANSTILAAPHYAEHTDRTDYEKNLTCTNDFVMLCFILCARQELQ